MSTVARSLFPLLNVLGAAIAVFAVTMLAPLAFALDEDPLVAYDTAIHFWRCLLHGMGGMGILPMVAILPLLGVGGTQLFRAESAGPAATVCNQPATARYSAHSPGTPLST